MVSEPRIRSIRLDDPATCYRDPTARTLSFYARVAPAVVGSELLDDLVRAADADQPAVRLSLHRTPDARLHEMIIFERASHLHGPKAHPAKAKSYRVLMGRMALVLFDEDGGIVDAAVLEPAAPVAYRLDPGQFHLNFALDDYDIHCETTEGPFDRDHDRIVPRWAPPEHDVAEQRRLRDRLIAIVRNRTGAAGEVP